MDNDGRFSEDVFIAEMQKKRDGFMDQISEMIRNYPTSNPFHELKTHECLCKEAGDLLIPLERGDWPSEFRQLISLLDIKHLWPDNTPVCYGDRPGVYYKDSLVFLYRGYAMFPSHPVACDFFVIKYIEDGGNLSTKGYVMDPLAVLNGKNPLFYIGVNAYNFFDAIMH